MLIIGIALVPWVACWFTLQRGYSATVRGVAFGWAATSLLVSLFSEPKEQIPTAEAQPSVTSESATTRPTVSEKPAPKEKPKPKPKKSAEKRCVIRIPSAPDMAVPALPSEEGFEEYGDAAAQGLSDREMTLVLAANGGKLLDPGTRCVWVDLGIMTTKARVLDGNFAGNTYYFPTEWTRQ